MSVNTSANAKASKDLVNTMLADKVKAEEILAEHNTNDPQDIGKLAKQEERDGHLGIAAWMYVTAKDFTTAIQLFEDVQAFAVALEVRIYAGMKPPGAALLESRLCERAKQFELAAMMRMKQPEAEDAAWAYEAKVCANKGDSEGAAKMRTPEYRPEWIAAFSYLLRKEWPQSQ